MQMRDARQLFRIKSALNRDSNTRRVAIEAPAVEDDTYKILNSILTSYKSHPQAEDAKYFEFSDLAYITSIAD